MGNNILDSAGSGAIHYSPVRHLASAIFPFSYKQKYMFMLSAFMDETGHPDDPNSKFIGMAGLVATSANWERFEKQWKATLTKFNLPYFHMKDFAHSRKHFEGWNENEGKRQELLGELLQTIRDAFCLPFGSIFSLKTLREFPKHLQIEAKSPYFLAFLGCSTIIADLMLPMRAYDENISTIFAEQTEFQHMAIDVYQVLREVHPAGDLLFSPVFRPMRDMNPLQAADLVAYELYKEADRRYYKPERKPRWAFDELTDIAKLSVKNIDTFIIERNEAVIKIHMADAQRRIIEAITGKSQNE